MSGNGVRIAEIQSVVELLEYVQSSCRSGMYLYRGQPFDKPLLPKIARNSDLKSDFLSIEKKLISQFTRRARPFLELEPKDDWDRLAIAQHYGMSTRLLDWTENPLIALWFAVHKKQQQQQYQHGSMDAAVWVFEVYEDDYMAAKGKPWNCERTRVFQPTHITKTIAAQSGWFTLHKYHDDMGRFIPLERNTTYRERLKQLRVPYGSFSSLSRQLDRCGINAASLFPDVRGLCEYLEWKVLGR